ncbi:hypothetical protein KRM28CT15_15130 [Krasilnikovia sp. M28-CT-15]
MAGHHVDADLDRPVFGRVRHMPDLEHGLCAFQLEGALLGVVREPDVDVLGEPDQRVSQIGEP